MKIENEKVTQEQITWSRNWLAKAMNCSSGSVMGRPDYPWFGCQNDNELGALIKKIAHGENETDLERVLDVMLNA